MFFTRLSYVGRRSRLRGPDYLAELILPLGARFILNVVHVRKFFTCKLFPLGIYEYVIAPTKVMDAVFVDALKNHVIQIVHLGVDKELDYEWNQRYLYGYDTQQSLNKNTCRYSGNEHFYSGVVIRRSRTAKLEVGMAVCGGMGTA